MRELTATEAARRFADVLDAVEHRRESFIVTRNGRRVAEIGPASRPNGTEAGRVLRELSPDPEWAREIAEVRTLLYAEDRDWPA